MLIVVHNKQEFLDLLPKGGRWAEIGVFRGDLSDQILKICQPAELHLIDPWWFALDFDWFAPPEVSTQYRDPRKFVAQMSEWTGVPEGVHLNDHFEALHEATKRRFAGDPRVRVHRRTSHDAAPLFPDGFFDFVYVDGAHDYENVLHDLTTYGPKVNPEGALLGDDFCDHGVYANDVYGVVGAVAHFRRISARQEMVINVEKFTNFGLFRPGSRSWKVFIDNLIAAGRPVIELPDALGAAYCHRPMFGTDGSGRLIQSFA